MTRETDLTRGTSVNGRVEEFRKEFIVESSSGKDWWYKLEWEVRQSDEGQGKVQNKKTHREYRWTIL